MILSFLYSPRPSAANAPEVLCILFLTGRLVFILHNQSLTAKIVEINLDDFFALYCLSGQICFGYSKIHKCDVLHLHQTLF